MTKSITIKQFLVHLSKLEDEQHRHSKASHLTCLIDLLSRSLYFILNGKGRATFETRVVKSADKGLSRHIEPLLKSRMDEVRQSCMDDLCTAAVAVHAIREKCRELVMTGSAITSVASELLPKELSDALEPLHRRLQFDAQKMLWNMFLGNREFLEVRDNSAWDELSTNDKAATLITWVCVLDLLFRDAGSAAYKFFHVDDAFTEYVASGDFRTKWRHFKFTDQGNVGMLTYILNVQNLNALMKRGCTLDRALFACLERFSKNKIEFPNQVEHFAHFFFGKSYADKLEALKATDKDGAACLKELNQSSLPQRSVAAGMCKGGVLLSHVNFVPEATKLIVDKSRFEAECKSLMHCSLANLKTLSLIRGHCREHHKQHRTRLVKRIVKELGRTEEEAAQDVVTLLWYLREGAPMLIHRAFQSLIPMMLVLDHYQSGVEANSFDPSRSVPRPEWEGKISGGIYKSEMSTMLEKKERPKYGAMNIVQDVLGINGGTFYGATYFTLKGLRHLATLSFTDTASDAIQGFQQTEPAGGDAEKAEDGDCCSSAFNGSECDLATLDYPLGVINDGWSKSFLQAAIDNSRRYVSSGGGAPKTRRELIKENSSFMDLYCLEGGLRQYDEFQVHGQVLFNEHVASVTICKPFLPASRRGSTARSDGKLIIINPQADYVDSYDVSPRLRKVSFENGSPHEQEYDTDDYYLFWPRLALLEEPEVSTEAFDSEARRFSEEQKKQFRQYLLHQQKTCLRLGALVRLEVPGHGPRYCFHVKRCLECLREKYPSLEIRRIVLSKDTWEFEFEK